VHGLHPCSTAQHRPAVTPHTRPWEAQTTIRKPSIRPSRSSSRFGRVARCTGTTGGTRTGQTAGEPGTDPAGIGNRHEVDRQDRRTGGSPWTASAATGIPSRDCEDAVGHGRTDPAGAYTGKNLSRSSGHSQGTSSNRLTGNKHNGGSA
jgi:hypothetical protein